MSDQITTEAEKHSAKRGAKSKRPDSGDILNRELPSLVTPTVAAVMSAVIPGLGQMFARRVQRGVILLAGAASVIGMFVWRFRILGERAEVPGWPVFLRALDRRPWFVGFILVALVAIWILSAIDAHRTAQRPSRSGAGAFLAIIAALFVLGWQVSEIDVGTAIQRIPDALPPLARVIWPWEAAVEFEENEVGGTAQILVSPEGMIPPQVDPQPGEPGVTISPRQGTLASQNLDGNAGAIGNVPGTEVTVSGFGFEPSTTTEIRWIDQNGSIFPIRQGRDELIVETGADGTFSVIFTLPFPLIGADPEPSGTIHQVQARQVFTGEATASRALLIIISRMVETIVLGMMATLFGIIFSIPVSFLAARNIMSGSRISMAIYYLVRFTMNVIRSIEPLIWVLIATVWVGLGPFAGIIALTMHSIAALSKLYSEAIEGIDPGPIEAIQATGANRLQTIAYAIIPQMISPFVSFSIYRWDINVRMSTVIGLVGGGGVGFILVQYVRLLQYRQAGIAVWFIAITVALLDYVSAEIRNKLA